MSTRAYSVFTWGGVRTMGGINRQTVVPQVELNERVQSRTT